MDDRLYLLVVIGADDTGRKEVLAIVDGHRENEQGWHEVLAQLSARGLKMPPKLAMTYKLAITAQKNWRRFRGFNKASRRYSGNSIQGWRTCPTGSGLNGHTPDLTIARFYSLLPIPIRNS
jgi:hypothetical protein